MVNKIRLVKSQNPFIYILSVLTLALSFQGLTLAQSTPIQLDGRWEGAINGTLPIILHIEANGDGYKVTLDSPAQNAIGLSTSDVKLDQNKFSFKVPIASARYDGIVSADANQITGTWQQGIAKIKLDFTRAQENKTPAQPLRPQTPKAPFDYHIEEVSFPSRAPDIQLAGTLTRPAGNGPYPAIIMITGSGPQDRDETIAGHKPFWVIADHLTKNGFAVLRYDDRGVGKSSGNFATATTRDFAQDSAGALNYLQTRSDIAADKIGYFGHSEGGAVAILAHQDNGAYTAPAAYLVLMTSLILPYSEAVLDQVRALSTLAGNNPVAVNNAVNVQKKIVDAALAAQSPQEAEKAVVEELVKAGVPRQTAQTQAKPFGSQWFYELLKLDTRPVLEKINVPVLGLWGEKDIQVNAQKHKIAAMTALKDNPQAELIILPALNHLLQPADTGNISEYSEIETTISPEALTLITNWLKNKTRDEN